MQNTLNIGARLKHFLISSRRASRSIRHFSSTAPCTSPLTAPHNCAFGIHRAQVAELPETDCCSHSAPTPLLSANARASRDCDPAHIFEAGNGAPSLLAAMLPLLCLLMVSGCAKTWQRGWELPPTDAVAQAETQAVPTIGELKQSLQHTRGEVDVLRLIQACERHLAGGRHDVETWAMLGMLQTLMGAAYEQTRQDKATRYVAAMQACEKAMALRPAFLQAIKAGQPFDQAVLLLGAEDMESMFFWNVAMQYYFKECLTPLDYPFNFNWIRRSQAILAHMRALDPDWGEGALHFARAVLLLGLPESLGGDMAQAHAILDQAALRWPKSIIFRWGRAKYWCTKARDEQCFVDDLRWVVRQSPDQTRQPPYPWNAYFIADARRMLRERDAYF